MVGNGGEITSRLARVEGQVRGIIKMIDSDRECAEILVQLSAVEKAVKNVSKILIKHHMNNCVKEAVQNGDLAPLEDFNNVLDKFL